MAEEPDDDIAGEVTEVPGDSLERTPAPSELFPSEETALEARLEAERTVGEVHRAILAHNRADRGPSRSRSRSRRGATATAEAALGRNASGRSEKESALVLLAEATIADGKAEAEAAAAANLDRCSV